MRYHNITTDDMKNGTGLRTVLWVAGCDHKCHNCHNPETWDHRSGIIFDKAAKNELFDNLSKDYIQGITFSGGDPLNKHNIFAVSNLINEIKHKFPNKNIWVYTGFTHDQILNGEYRKYLESNIHKIIYSYDIFTTDIIGFFNSTILPCIRSAFNSIDVLVDGEYIDELKSPDKEWVGSSNQNVINNPFDFHDNLYD